MKPKKSITVPIFPESASDLELLEMLDKIKKSTGMEKSAVYRSCLSIGAKMELEKINQLKAQKNETNN